MSSETLDTSLIWSRCCLNQWNIIRNTVAVHIKKGPVQLNHKKYIYFPTYTPSVSRQHIWYIWFYRPVFWDIKLWVICPLWTINRVILQIFLKAIFLYNIPFPFLVLVWKQKSHYGHFKSYRRIQLKLTTWLYTTNWEKAVIRVNPYLPTLNTVSLL